MRASNIESLALIAYCCEITKLQPLRDAAKELGIQPGIPFARPEIVREPNVNVRSLVAWMNDPEDEAVLRRFVGTLALRFSDLSSPPPDAEQFRIESVPANVDAVAPPADPPAMDSPAIDNPPADPADEPTV